MPDSPQAEDSQTDAETPAASPAPRRGPGHRAADARDTAAEMAARAHEISLEAGSKMAGAMREVIGAAAGLSEFAIESARDLIHYMVRRGQMAQEEAEHLITAAEGAYIAKHGALPKPEPKAPPAKPVPLGSTAKDQAASAAARAPRAEMPSVASRSAPVEKVSVKAESKSDDSAETKHAPKATAKGSSAESESATKAPAKAAAKAPAKAESKPATPTKPPVKAPVAKPAAKPPTKPAAKPAVKAAPVKATPAKAAKQVKAPAVSKAAPAKKAAAKKK